MRFRYLIALAAVWAVATSASASAQADGEPLTLPAAIRRALQQQPELQAFAYRLDAENARVGEAALGPETTAELMIEDALGSGDYQGVDAAQTTLSLSRVIELGGKRAGRVAVAEAMRSRVETERAIRQLDVVADVARRFIETLHGRERLRLTREAVQLAERTREAAARRVQAGLAPVAEVARAEARIAQAALELEHTEHEYESSRRFLAAAMGEREVRFGETSGDLFALETVAPLDELVRRLESSPVLLWFADEARLREAEILLAELKRRPDIQGQLGIRRFEQGGDFALVAGFRVPLQSGRRGAFAVDAARADRARTEAERESALLKLQAQLLASYRELEHAQLEARVLRERVIPALEEALARTEYAYQRGRYSYLELTDAQQELMAARLRLSEVCANFHLLRVEIERLTGQSLESAGVTP